MSILLGTGEVIYAVITNSHDSSGISGHFDNPAGLATTITALLPFSIYIAFSCKGYLRISGIIASLIFFVGLVLTRSRAGIIAVMVTAIFCLITSKHLRLLPLLFKRSIYSVIIILIAVCAYLYYIKKDSADGRILIWKSSISMIADKPLFGHGINSFKSKYMIYQAKYFEKHPDSRFSILADNVKHPFNEYLGFLLQLGIVGTCFLILLFFIVMKDSIRRDRNANYELSALLSLFCIGIVGLFSYPLYYSSILIIISINFFLLIGLSKTKIVVKIPTYILLIIFVPLSGFVLYDSVRMIRNERTWFQLKESFESDEMILHQYEDLLLKQKFDNPWFLYNYGAMLNKHGLHSKSIEIMKKCEHHLNDADVQILFAENYLKIEDYTNAERCAVLASQMCPNRFIPLYQLVIIYDTTNRKEDAITLARKIMNKPIKVNSPNIALIKLKISKFLGQ